MIELYRTIWRVTGRQQVLLIALSLLISALAAAPLKFQQLVINGLVYGGDVRGLGWLCGGFLGVVLLSAALKFALNYRLAILGERIVMLIRERLYANYVADAAVGTVDLPRRGTLVTMLSAEAEAVGAFAGAAIATPLMQIGTLISVIVFILASQPWLGMLALGRRRAAGGDRGSTAEPHQPSGAGASVNCCATPLTGSPTAIWHGSRTRSSLTSATCSRPAGVSSCSSCPRNSR